MLPTVIGGGSPTEALSHICPQEALGVTSLVNHHFAGLMEGPFPRPAVAGFRCGPTGSRRSEPPGSAPLSHVGSAALLAEGCSPERSGRTGRVGTPIRTIRRTATGR